MEIWLGTGNRGKLIEFRTLLPNHDIHSQSEFSVYSAPPETGKTFEDNARIKARSMKAMKPGIWAIGEDSGLEVIGLNRMPGIHSARYAGDHASDQENVAKVLKMLAIRAPMNRVAQFQCTIVAYSPEGKEIVVTGTLDGKIAEKARGTDGFGYDPIFIPEGETQTLAELGNTKKNQISHRAMAIRKLIEVLN